MRIVDLSYIVKLFLNAKFLTTWSINLRYRWNEGGRGKPTHLLDVPNPHNPPPVQHGDISLFWVSETHHSLIMRDFSTVTFTTRTGLLPVFGLQYQHQPWLYKDRWWLVYVSPLVSLGFEKYMRTGLDSDMCKRILGVFRFFLYFRSLLNIYRNWHLTWRDGYISRHLSLTFR